MLVNKFPAIENSTKTTVYVELIDSKLFYTYDNNLYIVTEIIYHNGNGNWIIVSGIPYKS